MLTVFVVCYSLIDRNYLELRVLFQKYNVVEVVVSLILFYFIGTKQSVRILDL